MAEKLILDTIMQGDSIANMQKLPDECIDLVFADPPYWMRVSGTLQRVEGTDFDGCDDEWDQFETLESYEKFTRAWLSECRRILKPNGSIWVIGGMQCIYTIGAIMQELGFWFINDVIWHKTNPTPNFKGTRLNNSHETLIWATQSQKSKYTWHYKTGKELNHDNVSDTEYDTGVRKQMGSVWRIPVCSGNERLKDDEGEKLHSTQKPEELLYRVIALTSSVGNVVFDPFGGTMTTGAVAKSLGRHYIMSERDPKYVEYGKRRLDAVKPVLDDVALAKFDEKPMRVTVPEMIADGFLSTGEKMVMDGIDGYVTLQADGKVNWNGIISDMHSTAAKMRGVKANRVNGFDYWCVIRDGKSKRISEVRDEYRAWRKMNTDN